MKRIISISLLLVAFSSSATFAMTMASLEASKTTLATDLTAAQADVTAKTTIREAAWDKIKAGYEPVATAATAAAEALSKADENKRTVNADTNATPAQKTEADDKAKKADEAAKTASTAFEKYKKDNAADVKAFEDADKNLKAFIAKKEALEKSQKANAKLITAVTELAKKWQKDVNAPAEKAAATLQTELSAIKALSDKAAYDSYVDTHKKAKEARGKDLDQSKTEHNEKVEAVKYAHGARKAGIEKEAKKQRDDAATALTTAQALAKDDKTRDDKIKAAKEQQANVDRDVVRYTQWLTDAVAAEQAELAKEAAKLAKDEKAEKDFNDAIEAALKAQATEKKWK